AAGRRAEIDDSLPRFEQAAALVHLHQLIGRARAIAFALGAQDVGVVELPLEPQGRGVRAFSRRANARRERARARAAAVSLAHFNAPRAAQTCPRARGSSRDGAYAAVSASRGGR